jgi:D-alanyl-lipoteichoic acid acyltransferase DltB (MBOAT superfamily)
MTMLIAGIWHGAGMQFIVFGLLHAIYLTINHAWRFFRREGALLTRIISPTPVGVLLTFVAVLVAQIFFRAASTHQALQVLAGLFGRHGVGLNALQTLNPHAFLVFALLPVVWFFPNTQEILGRTAAIRPNVFGGGPQGLWRPNMVWAGGLGALLVGVLWFMTDTSAFLYFQF